MQRPTNARLSAAIGLVLLVCVSRPEAIASEPEAAVEAAKLLKRDDHRGAIAILETALPKVGADDRVVLLNHLISAYSVALKAAEASGRKDEVEAFTDNLEILRRNRPSMTPTSAPEPVAPESTKQRRSTIPVEPMKPPSPSPTAPKTDDAVVKARVIPRGELPPAEPLPEPKPLPPAAPLDAPNVGDLEKPTIAEKTPTPLPMAAAIEPITQLQSADADFIAGRYEQAGKAYSALAKQRALPEDRRPQWAYCRAVSVVKRINDRPATPAEWAAIDSEIRSIQVLIPKHWFAEYLRNVAAERSQTARVSKPRSSSRLLVRGSSPEEFGEPPEKVADKARPIAATKRLQASALNWNAQPVVTDNFEVYYVGDDPTLANKASRAAELARAVQVKRWSSDPRVTWSPRCEILLYPNSEEFGKDTQQPPDSPGFSRMLMNAGRIVFRRVHLRTDHPTLVKAILPHEVTHVVLADVFPHQQIPRWADEGLAVLAEPASEQAVRAADLDEPLKAGKLFRVGDLMAMDYPDPEHLSLFYAESVSLTRFLVDTGTPEQFVTFLKHSQSAGFEPALNAVYQINSFADLQTRWLAFARQNATGATRLTATSRDPEKKPGQDAIR